MGYIKFPCPECGQELTFQGMIDSNGENRQFSIKTTEIKQCPRCNVKIMPFDAKSTGGSINLTVHCIFPSLG